jgi:hypothetical protein
MLLHVAALWLQYAELPEEEREGWAKEQGAPSALNKIITTGFKAIHLIYFFTAGADEVKCWQIRKGSKAPQVLHWPVAASATAHASTSNQGAEGLSCTVAVSSICCTCWWLWHQSCLPMHVEMFGASSSPSAKSPHD